MKERVILMGLTIEKGQSTGLSIDKGNSEAKITVGCGWNPRKGVGDNYDLDAWLLLIGADGKAVDPAGTGPVPNGLMFYNNGEIKDPNTGVLTAKDGSIVHHGDNLTGDGDGDDEVIDIYPNKVGADVSKIMVAVSIYHGKTNGQTFGMVDDCYAHVDVPGDNDYKVLMGEADNLSGAHTVILGQIYRDPEDATGASWKFKAIKEGFDDELIDVAKAHGVPIG